MRGHVGVCSPRVSLITHLVAVSQSGCTPSLHWSLLIIARDIGAEEESGVRSAERAMMATSSSSSYTVTGGKSTEEELIPYTTDTMMTSSKEKTDSLPKLINLEPRPASGCSSPTSSGGHKYAERWSRYLNCPGHICVSVASLFDKE